MGFRLRIGSRTYEAQGFSVAEAATPLAAGDSSGQVGTITFDIPLPDPFLLPNHPINKYGVNTLVREPVRLDDTRKGFTLGTVTSVSRSGGAGTITVTATSRLGELNVYNIQAAPFVGTLASAFEYYLSLANVTTDFLVDPAVASNSVIFPGWNGELWFHLKQMAIAVDCDVSLVSGVIILRPVRTREATRGRDIERTFNIGGGQLAQNIEVIQYNNRQITDELVYPPGGWSDSIPTINVNAGETITEILELSASVSSISQPVMQTFVARDYSASSVYTVVGDDGLPILPAAWEDAGGSLTVDINPDTVSLSVTITAPTGLGNKDGSEIGVYGISLSSDESTGRYSTLRIVGSGVAFDKQPRLYATGISPSESSTEIGVTIDNPFLSTWEDVSRAASRAVRAYNGTAMNISGTVVSINRRGDTGEIVVRDYQYVQDFAAGRTYAQMQTLWSGMSYLDVENSINTGQDDNIENQVFGNINGAAVWDEASRRWYRIRNASSAPDTIGFEAEDDLTHNDNQLWNGGLTYAQVQTKNSGLTYFQVDVQGLR